MISIERSSCLEGWLHRFILLRQLSEGAEEGCIICKAKRFYRIYNGRINDLLYLQEHARQALPRKHILLLREYPHAKNL